ncbi:MAG: histidine kinase [Paludibacter sp.]
MTKIEKYLPYIISLVLPGINILSNHPFDANIEWYSVLVTWLSATLLLAILWKILDKLLYIKNVYNKWLAVVFASFALIFTFSGISHLYLRPIIKLPENDWQWILGLRLLLATILYIAIIHSLRTIKEREKFRMENISLQSENLKAQLNQLRQQVNPHFLFNSLSTLRSMVRNNDPQSEEYILKLSDVYRQILQKRESAVVTLTEELEFLKAYIYLLKLRHENALTVEIKIIDESLQYSLPAFALQLLVENCIKHNVVSEAHPLNIHIQQPEASIITVSNNYQPKCTSDESFGLGTENLKTRYELLGITDGIQIEQTEKQYKTTLKLF